MLAAVCSAVSAGDVVPHHRARARRAGCPQRWQRIVGGALAALIGATAFTVWNQSVVNEKVYTVSLVGIAIISWLMVRWCDEPDGRKADRILVLVAYLLGLGYANHMAGMLAGAGGRRRGAGRAARGRCCAGSCCSRASARSSSASRRSRRSRFAPRTSRRSTKASRRRAARSSSATARSRKETCDALQVQLQSRAVRQAASSPSARRRSRAQVGMWWLYFKWQWLRDAHGEQPGRAGDARRGVPRARAVRRLGALPARPTKFLVLRPADVHA